MNATHILSRGAFALVLGVLAGGGAVGCNVMNSRMAMNDGNKLFKAQKYEEAIEKYAKVVEDDPDDWDANYQIAMSHLAMYHPGSTHPKDQEIYRNAIAGLEKVMTLDAPSEEALEKVHTYYFSLMQSAGDNDKSLAYLERRLKEKPDDKETLLQLAGLHAKLGSFDDALRYYEQVAKLDPKDKTAWYTIGVVCWERSNKAGVMMGTEERAATIERGLQALDKALAVDPEYFEAYAYVNLLWREKAYVLAEQGRHQEAAAAVAKALEYTKKAQEIRKKTVAAAT